jgi:hypothetical protein
MRHLLTGLLALLLAAPLASQRPGAPGAVRRAQLEAQVLQRFARQAGQEMRLDSAEQRRLALVVREVAVARRMLNDSAMDLRRRMATAVRDPAASDAQLEQLLSEHRVLRQREQMLWEREQARLQQILSLRQRAQFWLLWTRLQDEARGLMMQRGLGPRGGTTGPPGL